jgi:sugar/nucleoside kinase (ribokinase family)
MAPAPDILCIGSVLWDVIGHAEAALPAGGDVPGRITRQPGGVALNIAVALRRLGLRPAILSAVGRDAEGEELALACARLGLVTDFLCRTDDLATDRYMAIESAGALVAAVADARTLEAAGDRVLAPLRDGRLGSAASPWGGTVAVDGNLTAALLADMAASPLLAAADIRLAPASPAKAGRLAPFLSHPRATFYVNLAEAGLLCGATFDGAAAAAGALVARGAARALVTDGPRQMADAGAGLHPVTGAPPPVAVARVTGAGDSFMAAHVAAERRGLDRGRALDAALRAAANHVSGEFVQ